MKGFSMDGKENESEDFWERLVDGNGKQNSLITFDTKINIGVISLHMCDTNF